MKFLCGSCRTKYQISDEKVRGKILTIRCKKCGSKILVRESLARDAGGGTAVAPVAEEEKVGEVQRSGKFARVGGSAALASAYDVAMDRGSAEADDMPTSIAPVPANLEIAGVEWYVAIDGVQHGPYAFAELVAKLQNREVIGRHYVWHDGMDNWQRVRDVADLADYISAPKKKPPPPPPVSIEAPVPRSDPDNVVDMASARAARGQLGATPIDDDVADDDQTAVEQAGVLGPVEEEGTKTDRAEQLDVVLNEALGIEGEGQTTRAEPEAAERASQAVASAKIAGDDHTPSIEDLLAFEAKEDDIFANVPRAEDEPDVVRESTRFFVAAAGVNEKRKRNRVGFLIGGVAVLLIAAFVGAWANGIIQISIPGIGNPFARADAGDEDSDEYVDDEDDGNYAHLLEGKKPKKRVVKKKKSTATKKKTTEGGYIDDGAVAGLDRGMRGAGDAEGIAIDDPLRTGGGAGVAGVKDAELPGSGIEDVAPPDRAGALTESDINRVIAARKGAVSTCFEVSLRAQENLGGKIEFEVTVESSGKVSKVDVATTAFSGSRLGSCIAKKIKGWRFPTFEGPAQQIVVPFILQRQSY